MLFIWPLTLGFLGQKQNRITRIVILSRGEARGESSCHSIKAGLVWDDSNGVSPYRFSVHDCVL